MSSRTVKFNIPELEMTFLYSKDRTLSNTLRKALNCKGKGARDLSIKIIEDEKACFINLFGIFVDINTGNIALGLFPNPDSYVKVGNIRDLMRLAWFGPKGKCPKELDLRYILQLLKLDPVYYEEEIIEELRNYLDNRRDNHFDSVMLNVHHTKSTKRRNTDELRFFEEKVGLGTVSTSLIYKCVELAELYEEVASKFFKNFISEKDYSEVKVNSDKSLSKCLHNSRNSNLDSLILKYLGLGIPIELLLSLKSYGYDIKGRKLLIESGNGSPPSIIDIGIGLGSMFYARNVLQKEYILAYNFMDLLRSVDWDQNLLFALDSILEFNTKSVWESLLKRFNIYSILKERGLSEKEFALGIDSYRKDVLVGVDTGTLYKRYPSFSQYCMLAFSAYEIEKAGRIFNMSFNMIKKSFSNKSE